jgi:hypothetical protein
MAPTFNPPNQPRPQYGGPGGPPPNPLQGYLQSGFLDEKGNPWPEMLTTTAQTVANVLSQGVPPVAYSQMRRFWAKIRFIELQLDTAEARQPKDVKAAFDEVRWRIAELRPDAADAVNRNVASPLFRTVIEKNVEFAQRDAANFRRGMMRHLRAVICYYPRQRGN